ncbi:DUF4250 domain-containing protein [Clostridium sp. 1001271B_151109_B4]|uniref:DUF4250 domain-containing protein n=1 Tax=Clostridium sp. 1001271B_151109_B4 TaxID=2787148 RepID=UPI0018A9E0B6|nr:DUF4250 domain-containing protein [Clostridium sp. 1001271B_151109_B4]
MDKETLMKMDPNILVSMVNMKLRDYYSSLDQYCDDIGLEREYIEKRLGSIGYKYCSDINQFK